MEPCSLTCQHWWRWQITQDLATFYRPLDGQRLRELVSPCVSTQQVRQASSLLSAWPWTVDQPWISTVSRSKFLTARPMWLSHGGPILATWLCPLQGSNLWSCCLPFFRRDMVFPLKFRHWTVSRFRLCEQAVLNEPLFLQTAVSVFQSYHLRIRLNAISLHLEFCFVDLRLTWKHINGICWIHFLSENDI